MEDLRERATGADELEVRIDRGDITVRCGESTDWGIEWSGDGEAEPRIEREGPTLTIRQHGHTFRRLDIALTVPRGLRNVEVRTGMGRISVEGIDGHLNAEDGNGAVVVRSCSGDAAISSGNGRLLVERSGAGSKPPRATARSMASSSTAASPRIPVTAASSCATRTARCASARATAISCSTRPAARPHSRRAW